MVRRSFSHKKIFLICDKHHEYHIYLEDQTSHVADYSNDNNMITQRLKKFEVLD